MMDRSARDHVLPQRVAIPNDANAPRWSRPYLAKSNGFYDLITEAFLINNLNRTDARARSDQTLGGNPFKVTDPKLPTDGSLSLSE